MKITNNMKKVFCIMPITIIYNLDMVLSQQRTTASLNDFFIFSTFDMQSILENKSLILTMFNVALIIVFNLFFGTTIYREFADNGVYLFTRIRDRKKWFFKKAMKIVFYSGIYSLLYLIVTLCLCMIHKGQLLSWSVVPIFVLMWFALSVVTILTTMIINFFSIFHGEQVGFIVGYSVFIVFIMLALNFDDIYILGSIYYLSFWNPVNVLSLYLLDNLWHQIFVVLYNIGIVGGLFIYIAKKINKMDIAIHSKEMY